jgi:curved DNA-binding protein
MRTYYDILGVSRNASQQDIKKAFRLLARKLHPDVNGGDAGAEERFKEVHEAYQVLYDEETRKAYDIRLDNTGREPSGRPDNTAGARTRASSGGGAIPFDKSSLEQDFQRFFGFHPKTGEATAKPGKSRPDNPLDTTAAFEQFFGRKKK